MTAPLTAEARYARTVELLARVLSDVGSTDTLRVKFSNSLGMDCEYIDHGGKPVQITAPQLRELTQRGLLELVRNDLFPIKRVSTYRVTEAGHAALEEWQERASAGAGGP